MNIAIIGASGKAGKLIMKEALDRGHAVTAIVRDASKITDANVSVLEKDIFALKSDDLKGFDVAGSYVKGKDHLLVNASGQSYISYADYAIAVLDEIENPQHRNERFTVGSK